MLYGYIIYSRLSLLLVAALVATLVFPAAAVAQQDEPQVVDMGDDVIFELGDLDSALPLQSTDPLALVVGVDTLRQHSRGNDILDVWACGVNESPDTLARELEAKAGAWYDHHSRGLYRPVFHARGNAGNTHQECLDHSRANASADANGALHIIPGGGGFGGPGVVCGFTPCPSSSTYRDGNRRFAFIGSALLDSTAVHEMGHMNHWPHSYSGTGPDEYDNALDVMSGNYGLISSSGFGSFPDPYSTAAINLYAAGWIDPHEVYVFSGGDGATLNLATMAGKGHKMAVIQAGSRYYTLAARIPSTHDPIPSHWSGIEVYEVQKCTASAFACLNDSEMSPGFRRVKPHPAVPFDFSDRDAYDQPLAHVIDSGESRTVNGVNVSVGARSGQSYRVSIGPDPRPIPDPPTFRDTAGNTFLDDIEWLAASGITRGCNPPINDLFCPDDVVTRGAMAAFLVRALNLTTEGSTFRDTAGHTFERDISRLAEAGITRGCNPPVNDRFCPNDPVTRGAMAAFLVRALNLTTEGSTFRDTAGHTFERDISRLAEAGITRGCNPPVNDRFCPNDVVTRGAMAAFLHRAPLDN